MTKVARLSRRDGDRLVRRNDQRPPGLKSKSLEALSDLLCDRYIPRFCDARASDRQRLLTPLGVVIDGHDVRVELDRGAALLMRAEPRGFHPAEGHVHLRPGGLRVHMQDAGP